MIARTDEYVSVFTCCGFDRLSRVLVLPYYLQLYRCEISFVKLSYPYTRLVSFYKIWAEIILWLLFRKIRHRRIILILSSFLLYLIYYGTSEIWKCVSIHFSKFLMLII